jgi:ribokinase
VEPEELESVNWAAYQALHLDGWSTEAAIEAAQQMKAAGGRISVDLGSPKPNLETLVGSVDWVNCPLRLLETLYPGEDIEKAGRRLIEMGASEVTVTIGVDGMKYQRAFSIQAVDTNGAGDVFSGAMIYGAFREWGPERRLRFASAAAALKCCAVGNREALPTLKQVESFLLEEN